MSTTTTEQRKPQTPEVTRLMDALELAWGIIANASGGNWERESPEWQEAAHRWRDQHWHPALNRNGYTPREDALSSTPES